MRTTLLPLCLLALAALGCGRPTSTVTVLFTGHGAPPAAVTQALVVVESVRVRHAADQTWSTLLNDEEGGRAFDLLALGPHALVAERDIFRDALDAVSISFDHDEAPLPGQLPLERGLDAGARLVLPLPATDAAEVHVELDFDLASSLVAVDGGSVVFQPAMSARQVP